MLNVLGAALIGVLERGNIAVSYTHLDVYKRQNYDIAIGLYQKGLQLMRLAAKRPGG